MKLALLALLGYMSAEDAAKAVAKVRYRDFGFGSLVQVDADEDEGEEGDGDDDDEGFVQYPGDEIMGWYMPWHHSPPDENGEGAGDYVRAIPHYFEDGTDVFMRSMINTYAMEEKKCVEDEEGNAVDCEPTGNFFLNKIGAKAAAKEVLYTHKGLSGMASTDYLDAYFDTTWAHFAVNAAGILEVSKMPQFMRFLSSDQRMSLGE